MPDAKTTDLTNYTTPIDTDVVAIVDVTTDTSKKITKANLTANKTDKLTVTAVKTTTYSANANELVPCDVSGGSFTVTLPSAPATGSIVQVKLVTIGSNKVLTLACGGSDKFNTATGNTSIYMTLQGEVISVQYASGVWYVFASATTYDFATNFPGVDATTPLSQADVAFNPTTRVLTITPPLGYFNIFVGTGNGDIIRYRKTGNVDFPAITDTSGSWYFYFNSSGTAVSTQTAWTTTDFPTAVPIYRLLWNATLYRFTVTAANATVGATYTNNGVTYTVVSTIAGGTTLDVTGTGDPEASGDLTKASGTGDATIAFSAFSSALKPVAEYVEYHANDISADDHQWFHLYGAVWRHGADMKNNAITSGSPAANGSNSVVSLTTASIVDDNLGYVITNGTGGATWEQDMGNTTPASITSSNSGLFPIYTQNAGGLVNFIPATRFPFAFNASTNLPQFITSVGVRTDVTTTNFFVYFIYATQNPKTGQAIKLVSATTQFTSLTNARAYTWTDIQNVYSILNDGEIRPLYRLIFETKSSGSAYDVGAKYSALRETQDLRKAAVTTTTTATGSIPASSVTVVAAGGIASTNAQSALEELDSEKANLASPTFTGTVTTPAIKITTGAGANKLLTSDADGDATWENAPTSVSVTTKGDLQTYSTTPDRLPVGTDGYVLESRASETTGLKWVAPIGTSSFVYGEVPSGTPNGTLTDFVLAATPVTNTLQVYLDGVLQKSGAGNDYTLATATITFLTAPLTGSNILCSYQSIASTAGNADTLDGQHGAYYATAITTPTADGWTSANETWTYASANTITVPSGAASKYVKGDKIKYTAGAAVHYHYVVTVADTLLTVVGDTVHNDTMTANYYSHQISPIGFPQEFNYTPTGPTNTTLTGRFNIIGTHLFGQIKGAVTSTPSFASWPTLPVAASASIVGKLTSMGSFEDTGTAGRWGKVVGVITASATTILLYNVNDTSTGDMPLFSATVPITWVNTDNWYINFDYEI